MGWFSRFLRKPKREIRYAYQRITRGFSDRETWNVQHEFAKWVVPRLKRFKKVNNGTPYGLSPKEWDEKLNEMIEGFSIVASDQYWGSNEEDDKKAAEIDKKNAEKIDRAVDLWAEYFHDLWW